MNLPILFNGASLGAGGYCPTSSKGDVYVNCYGSDNYCCYNDSSRNYPYCCSDTSYVWVWILIVVVIVAMITGIVCIRKRKQRQQQQQALLANQPQYGAQPYIAGNYQ